MAVKYKCASCDRKFVDWGAEKLNFKCPDCDNELEPTSQSVAAKPKPAKKSAPSTVNTIPAPKRVTSFDDSGDAVTDDDTEVDGGDDNDDLDEDVGLDDDATSSSDKSAGD